MPCDILSIEMGFFKGIKKILGRTDDNNDNNNNIAPEVSLGRNETCWCGSGLKYKRCHLESDTLKRSANRPLSCGPT